MRQASWLKEAQKLDSLGRGLVIVGESFTFVEIKHVKSIFL